LIELQPDKIGIDVGVKALLVDSQGNYYGTEHYDAST
jgi:hypothetical protein